MGKVAQTKFLRSLTVIFVDFVFTLFFIAFMLLAPISTSVRGLILLATQSSNRRSKSI
jgi:hypothetical protein